LLTLKRDKNTINLNDQVSIKNMINKQKLIGILQVGLASLVLFFLTSIFVGAADPVERIIVTPTPNISTLPVDAAWPHFEYYPVPPLSANYMIIEHDVCGLFTDYSNQWRFIPTETDNEWFSVLDATETTNLDISTCAVNCEAIHNPAVVCSVTEACNGDIELRLRTDNDPEETSWTLENSTGQIIAADSYNLWEGYRTFTYDWTLDPGNYTFTISDSRGDGFGCCSPYYQLTDGCSTTFKYTNGNYGSEESFDFCIPSPGGQEGKVYNTNEDSWVGWGDGSDIYKYEGYFDETGTNFLGYKSSCGTSEFTVTYECIDWDDPASFPACRACDGGNPGDIDGDNCNVCGIEDISHDQFDGGSGYDTYDGPWTHDDYASFDDPPEIYIKTTTNTIRGCKKGTSPAPLNGETYYGSCTQEVETDQQEVECYGAQVYSGETGYTSHYCASNQAHPTDLCKDYKLSGDPPEWVWTGTYHHCVYCVLEMCNRAYSTVGCTSTYREPDSQYSWSRPPEGRWYGGSCYIDVHYDNPYPCGDGWGASLGSGSYSSVSYWQYYPGN
jgi:hypothetical protein